MLRKLALFLLPTAILGITPREPLYAGIICLIYLLIVIVERASSSIGQWSVGYVVSSVVFLGIALFRADPNDNYAISKCLFVAFGLLPAGLWVAMLIRTPDDVKRILWGYAVLSWVVAAVALTDLGGAVLGSERYQWQGNLCAMGAAVALQFWIIRKWSLACLLAVYSIAGLGLSAAKQSLGVLGACVALLVVVRVSTKRRNIIPIMVLAALCFANWEIILRAEIFRDMLWRLQFMRTGGGGYTLLERGWLYDYAWDGFKSHPIIGIGTGQFDTLTHGSFPDAHRYPHSVFLELLCEHGLVGFLLLAGPLFYAAWLMGTRALKGDEPSIGILLLFLFGVTTGGLTGDLTTRPLWIFGVVMIRMLTFRPKVALAGRHRPTAALSTSWVEPTSAIAKLGQRRPAKNLSHGSINVPARSD